MATIRICDYTKLPLDKGVETVVVKVGDKEFEVGPEGAKALLTHLESDEPPQVVERPVAAPAAPRANVRATPPPPPPLDVETNTAPFANESLPQDAMPVHLEIPEDINKRLGVPSKATWERVMQEAKRFEPGTLASLSPGSKSRQQAARRLGEIEASKEGKLKRDAGSDVNFKSL